MNLFDANGNRTQASAGANSYAYAYTPNTNRLQSVAGPLARSYAYDAAGNVTGDGVNGFLIDRSGRLSQATGPWGQATYRFDGLGRRVGKTRSGGGAETYYVYDDAGHLIGEYSATGQALQETVWLGDTPVAVLKAGVLYYVHADHLDAPRVITDSQNRVVWRWDNADAFGVGSPNENPSGLGIFTYNLRFPGQFFDQETGLHYNYFRDSYDPRGGRYLQADPIGLDGGLNLYAYVGGNPVSRIDPSGLIGLEFVRETGSLYVYDDFGEYMFACRAGNNVARGLQPWPMGFFPYSHYNRHSESGPAGRFGSHGIYVFDVPGRRGVGVHSGRRGPESNTEGCVRTTDPCMDVLNRLHRQTPITDIMVH